MTDIIARLRRPADEHPLMLLALCDEAADEIERGDKLIAKLMAEKAALQAQLDRAARARDIAGFNITELSDQKIQLTGVLNDALMLIEHMIGELHHNGIMPRPALMFAHKQFQDKMAKLLGQADEKPSDAG